ncbi:peptidyl-tRNA hydrolase [Faunimonas pinastri]|uniref:Peptidyl-tRNA hydrolase n=1 Tax=Faunimonas pinastri TaxID=1855383 RepID=A0A1H9AFB7_9HYPH|nr:aminoacyl-tRNA hydrolase [Faunimonas pinastri]SEP75482.1 peptidyl-tRNA hydrolase [Faunimonas pinastri]
MLLIVGLGNPGTRYQNNRHNIGFMAADEIVRRHGFSPWRSRFDGEVSEGVLGGEKAIVLKPSTFMNESGRSVGQAMRFFKITPADIAVMHDELDLAAGKFRVKTGGGNGGHNGLRSIDAHIGKDYRRLRLGIGHPGHKELVLGHVLGDFSKADGSWLEPLLRSIADHAPMLAEGADADSRFMNRVHLDVEGGASSGSRDGKAAEKPKREAPSPAPVPATTDNRPKPGAFVRADPQKASESRGGALADGLKKLLGRD